VRSKNIMNAMWSTPSALWESATWKTDRDLKECRNLLLGASSASVPGARRGRMVQVVFVGSSFHVRTFDPWRLWRGSPYFRGVLLPLSTGTLVSGRFNPDIVTVLAAITCVGVAGLLVVATLTLGPGTTIRTLATIGEAYPGPLIAGAIAMVSLGILRGLGWKEQYRCLRAIIDEALLFDSRVRD
jgi:hypothetical protein